MADELVRLNANWRVADDPPQWTLEQRTGNPSAKNSGWRARKFIRNQDHLLRRIGELCGKVDPDAIETIKSWPDGYVTWKARELKAAAGPKTAPYSAISISEALDHPKIPDAHVAAPESAAQSISDQAAMR